MIQEQPRAKNVLQEQYPTIVMATILIAINVEQEQLKKMESVSCVTVQWNTKMIQEKPRAKLVTREQHLMIFMASLLTAWDVEKDFSMKVLDFVTAKQNVQ